MSGCDERSLLIDAEGRVAYEWAAPADINPSITHGHFTRENGCIVFTRDDGRRFLPILPEGQLYAVEPMQSLFDGHWAISGLDENSAKVKSLKDDPVAMQCDAAPAFVTDIRPLGLSPPVPSSLSIPPLSGADYDRRSAPKTVVNDQSRQAARQTLQRYFALVEANRTDDAAKLWTDRRRGADFTARLYRFGRFQPSIAEAIGSNDTDGSAQVQASLQLLRKSSSGMVSLSDGTAVLQRANEHPGTSSDPVLWLIDHITLHPPPAPLAN
ncbi:MAG: hypothetical protein V7676_17220 [Parasphingorhabdus sp.]|uniref:hypothetical protein n=1 Tax=Parasphingorhabdus sp. TaxID=2709688 RepID=UPI003003444F